MLVNSVHWTLYTVYGSENILNKFLFSLKYSEFLIIGEDEMNYFYKMLKIWIRSQFEHIDLNRILIDNWLYTYVLNKISTNQ